jgi:hypothetical protein
VHAAAGEVALAELALEDVAVFHLGAAGAFELAAHEVAAVHAHPAFGIAQLALAPVQAVGEFALVAGAVRVFDAAAAVHAPADQRTVVAAAVGRERVGRGRRRHAGEAEQDRRECVAHGARDYPRQASRGRLLQLEGLAVELAAVALAAGVEGDLLAAHLAFEREGLALAAQRAGEHLELLLERHVALRRLVAARDLGRHDPEQRRAPGALAAVVRVAGLVGLPVAHGEGVGDDARAGLHVEDLGTQLEIDVRQQEERDHRRLGEIGLEEVGLDERGAGRDAFLRRVALRELDHVRVVFDAHRARAALRRGDDGAAVARAEVHVEVLRRELRHVEHLVHQRLRRRHPDDVLAFLSDGRLKGGLRLCGCKVAEGQKEYECKAASESVHGELVIRSPMILAQP